MGLLDAAAGAITGGSSQKLAKLTIVVERTPGQQNPFTNAGPGVEVMFNPATITHALTSSWVEHAVPKTGSATGQSAPSPLDTLVFTLDFDTTESAGDLQAGTLQADRGVAGSGSDARDVRHYSSFFAGLTRPRSELHHPPLCHLTWGKTDSKGQHWFVGFATSVTQTFSYFDVDGTPLRAKLVCSFKEWISPVPLAGAEFHSTDVYKSHLVKRGDSLPSIAQQELHDAQLWRPIAEANGITDPLDLRPGRMLLIPTVNNR